MALNDNRVCRGCGRMGVTRHTCPSCPCNYCKKDGRARFPKERVVRVHKYSKKLFTAVRKLRQEKVQKNFIYPNLEEDNHDKVPIITRINISRQLSCQPTGYREGLEDRDYESEDNSEESSDEPANIIEISLNITDEAKFIITEGYDIIDSQQLDNSKIVAGKKVNPYKERLLQKLYDGGLFNPYKLTDRN
jgi:hypothetical protein